jgi:hypothetical protein
MNSPSILGFRARGTMFNASPIILGFRVRSTMFNELKHSTPNPNP